MAFDLQTQLAKFLADLYAGTLGVTLPITALQLGDGTVAAPCLAFASQPTFGLFKFASGSIGVTNASSATVITLDTGANVTLFTGGSFQWGIGTLATTLTSASAGVTKLANATAASTAEFQVSGGSGGFISSVKALTELTTIAAAATTTTAIQIPANAVVLGVSVRVVTIIPTAATFTVTSATPTKTWNTAAVTVAAGSTDPGTLGATAFQTTASSITITPNLTPGAATGQVRVTIFYYTITPPTS